MESSQEQQEQYDRQIRLWGLAAQQRMQQSSVLICGLTGLHVEVIKNLVLCGLNVTIQDTEIVTADDLSSNYFLTPSDIGRPRSEACIENIRDLNRFSVVSISSMSMTDLNLELLSKFQLVLVSNCTENDAFRINIICRENNIPFMWSAVFAFEGCFFTDLGNDYRYANEQSKIEEVLQYPSLSDAFSMKWSNLKAKKVNVSSTYVKFRILESFRNIHGRLPDRNMDLVAINELVAKMLAENNLLLSFFRDISSGGSDLSAPTFSQQGDSLICDFPDTWASYLPVCSVVGGILSQEVVKITTRVGLPMRNFFVYSANDFIGRALFLNSDNNNRK